MIDGLGISKLVAVPSVQLLHDLIMAAKAVENHVNFGLVPRQALLDLRFSTSKTVTYNVDFLALSIFGEAVENGGNPREIVLNPKQPDLAITYIHELGHCVDYYLALPLGEFSSPKQDLFADWREAVWSTDASDRLWYARNHEGDAKIEDHNGRRVSVPINRERARALSMYHELWARSFTQYVVTESQKLRLERLLDDRQADPRSAVYGLHWTPDEFEPIRKTVERILWVLSGR